MSSRSPSNRSVSPKCCHVHQTSSSSTSPPWKRNPTASSSPWKDGESQVFDQTAWLGTSLDSSCSPSTTTRCTCWWTTFRQDTGSGSVRSLCKDWSWLRYVFNFLSSQTFSIISGRRRGPSRSMRIPPIPTTLHWLLLQIIRISILLHRLSSNRHSSQHASYRPRIQAVV